MTASWVVGGGQRMEGLSKKGKGTHGLRQQGGNCGGKGHKGTKW